MRKVSTRPGGPSGPGRTTPVAKPRIDPAPAKGSLATVLSWRTGVLVGVIILAAAVLMPTVRAYFAQQDELRELRAEVEDARTEVEDLEAEVARWDDPAFVVAQARERLAYVFPGETPYTVIDPEFVQTHAEGSPAAARLPGADASAPWFEVMWDSILVAGNGPPVTADEAAAANQPEDDTPLTDVDFGG
ncbi:MAG: septum formation initiator family protein [Actinomycetales bacterium]|nr:septum formation initiator family protein [Actinomycetales bacterium]